MNLIKRMISAVTAAVMITSCFTGVTVVNAEDNLIANGDFESALLGSGDVWTFKNTGGWFAATNGGTGEVSTDTAHGGTQSLKLSNATAGQSVTLNAGTAYTLTVYVKGTAGKSAYVHLNDGLAEYPDDGKDNHTKASGTVSLTADWQEVTVSYTPDTSQAYVICLGAWDGSTVYFDDATLTGVEGEYDGGGIINGNFANGNDSWTIESGGPVSIDNGVLTASGSPRVSQVVTGLDNGTYNLKATAYTSDIKEGGISYLYAKTEGHTMASTSIPEGSTMQNIIVPNIVVENGKCDIGLYLEDSAEVTLDNLALVKTEDTRVPFYKGGEISKLTYLESKGTKYRRADGTEADALQIMAENGFNMARIRLLDAPGKGHGDEWNYLPEGFMTEEDCLELARRAKDKGMAIEFTIAYSDYWVDGINQIIPYRWREEIAEQGITETSALATYLEDKVYKYTKDILQKLIDQGTCPEIVSIGNEMQCGILFGTWTEKGDKKNGLYYNTGYQTRLLNAGARAVREVSEATSSNIKIALHSHNGGTVSNETLFMNCVKNVDCDVIAVSYYPFYNDGKVSIDDVVSEFNKFINTYDKDVLIMETGFNWNPYKYDANGGEWDGQLWDSGYYDNIYGESKEGQRAFLTELYSKLKQVAGGRCIGDLYWDPIMVNQNGVGWAERESDDQTDKEVVSNSTIFDFDHKATPGQLAMKYNTNSSDNLLITGKITNEGAVAALTKAAFTVNGTEYNITTDKYGDYIVSVPYPAAGVLNIALKGSKKAYNDVPAAYDGVLMSGYDFDDFDTSTETEYVEPLGGFADTLTIEKTDGGLIITSKDGAPLETLILYAAVYNSDRSLKEVTKIPCAADENKIIVPVQKPATGSGETYKLLLWSAGSAPVIKAITE